MKRTKSYEIASFKALPDADGQTGRFEAIVSVFGNVDLQGDRVVKGAFAASLKSWKSSGDPIPVIWSHDWADPFAHIGSADPELAEETDVGLKIVGQLDVNKPFAAQVYDLLKTRRVREWSFAYDIEDERKAKDGANELLQLGVHEIGPTLKGANPDTATLGVKSVLEAAAAKAGRVLSKANETKLRGAHTSIGEVLAGLPEPEEDAEKSRGRKNVYTFLAGSVEARQETIHDAVRAWAGTNVPGYPHEEGQPWIWVGVAGTYSTYVIVHVESDAAEDRFIRLDYTVSDDGLVAFGNAQDVGVDVTVTVKSEEPDGTKDEGAKPWRIEERDGEFCVIKTEDGSLEKCHPTREEAEAHMRALYASEADIDPTQVVSEIVPPADETKNRTRLATELDLLLADV